VKIGFLSAIRTPFTAAETVAVQQLLVRMIYAGEAGRSKHPRITGFSTRKGRYHRHLR